MTSTLPIIEMLPELKSQWEEAKTLMCSLLQKVPISFLVYFNISLIIYDSKDFKKALSYYGEVWFLLGYTNPFCHGQNFKDLLFLSGTLLQKGFKQWHKAKTSCRPTAQYIQEPDLFFFFFIYLSQDYPTLTTQKY